MTRALTERLEARILEDPGQWIWIHRRWKPKRQRKRAAKASKAPS
jgi:KDO2-lipid IV(A) lauroyltransferase